MNMDVSINRAIENILANHDDRSQSPMLVYNSSLSDKYLLEYIHSAPIVILQVRDFSIPFYKWSARWVCKKK